MKTLMIAAMHSGAGKTVLSCALLAALKERGVRVQAYKCGPDYIDPMFHRRVLGVPSRNLDLFLQGGRGVERTLARADAALGLIEGAMGYYDGVGMGERASAWELAKRTGTPTVLAVHPAGAALTLAAQLRGMLDFRPDSGIRALVLTRCGERLAEHLTPMLERETGLPVLGCLPPLPAGEIPGRHLGLVTAEELTDFQRRAAALGEAAARCIDLDRLLSLAAARPESRLETPSVPARCRIAVARDEAFCFFYEDNLDALREAGAALRFFSPLRDRVLPEAEGLYLPGGYPELHAGALAANGSMRESVRAAVARGLPTVAECGGFLYLQRTLEDAAGTAHPMCGALPGAGFRTGGLRRFGYLYLEAEADSLLLRRGERLPTHEFHHWDSSENGGALRAVKPDGRAWRCGFVSDTLYAAFPHLHFGGEAPLAQRFVEKCEAWKALMT